MMATTDVLNLFQEKEILKICAPMVRYSKVQFRTLVRSYNCDLCFSPMIMADSFCKSNKARENEFKRNKFDTPLIVQFAANKVHDFVGAALMVSPYCNGVDLNCGCPQGWAKKMGLGCAMLQQPELIFDLVKECRNNISKPFTISIKTRILSDMKKTIEICKQMEMAGISFLTVHARTPSQSKGDINIEVLKLIRENIDCPLVVNGGIRNLQDCFTIQEETGCKGVMVANNILSNPTIFSGNETVPLQCVQDWLDICYNSSLDLEDYISIRKSNTYSDPVISERPKHLTFQCFHHHLVFMMEKLLSKPKRRIFNNYQTFFQTLNFLKDEFNLRPKLYDIDMYKRNSVLNINYDHKNKVYDSLKEESFNLYECDDKPGKYFQSKLTDAVEDDYNLSEMYTVNY